MLDTHNVDWVASIAQSGVNDFGAVGYLVLSRKGFSTGSKMTVDFLPYALRLEEMTSDLCFREVYMDTARFVVAEPQEGLKSKIV